MQRVLLLSATTGYQLRAFGDAADRAGCELLFATDRCHRLDDPWQDRAVAVRFHDVRRSVRAIREAFGADGIDGVLAVGDRPVPLAAAAAEALCVTWHPADAAAASGDKQLARARLAGAGLPVPWFTTIALEGDPARGLNAAAARGEVRFPCVLKPLGLSGSRGVIRADSRAEAHKALARICALLARPDVRALRTGAGNAVLVEGYLDGREFALEGVLTRGRLQTFAVFEKPDPLEGPFFEETIYLAPSALGPDGEAEAAAEVARAARALGLFHGPIHAEFRLGPAGLFVLEIAARPIGGLCARVLRFGSAGDLTLEDVLLRHALGEDIRGLAREPAAAGVMMIPIPRAGILRRVDGQDAARQVPGIESVHVTAKANHLLEPLPEGGTYLGFLFARGDSPGTVDDALREAHRRLDIVMETPIPVTTRTG